MFSKVASNETLKLVPVQQGVHVQYCARKAKGEDCKEQTYKARAKA